MRDATEMYDLSWLAVVMFRSTTKMPIAVWCVWFAALCLEKQKEKFELRAQCLKMKMNFNRNPPRCSCVNVVVVVSVAYTLASAYKSIYFGFHDSWQELLLSFALIYIYVVRNLGCVKCSIAIISCCVYWNFV